MMKERVYKIKRLRQKIIDIIVEILLLLPGIFICIPILLLITGSVASQYELKISLSPIFDDVRGFISWKLMPDYPTFFNYAKLLFMTPQFFVLFWNSMKLVACILTGQLLVGVPAAWGFAAYRFQANKGLFTLYVILMLLPFQVTMLSSYLVLNKLNVLNTHAAVILPAVFSTFPIFLTYGGFRGIPEELLDAARIDGAGELAIFFRIGLPLGSSGILSAVVFGFLEYWNMMEQPLAFLDEMSKWPLSLYLPEIDWTQAGYSFAASVITLIPAVFVFIMGQDYLEQGIIYSGLKE